MGLLRVTGHALLIACAIVMTGLSRADVEISHAIALHGQPALPALWARRSAFRRHGAPLLVTEIFLPAIRHLNP